MKFIPVMLASIVWMPNVSAQLFTHPEWEMKELHGAKPWTNKPINDKPGQFQFVIVTDRTGGHRPGVFENGVQKINLLQPEFVMSVGDLIEGYTTDTVELNRQWDEFSGFVEKLDMPFFYVPGNHDLTNPTMEKVWSKRFGPTYYSFVYKDVLFLCVNSEDQTRGAGKGSISQPQLEWIQKTLAENTHVKWTFLFMHQPLWDQQTDPVKWFEVERALENRPHTVFVGHVHRYEKYQRNNASYYVLATMGGGSPLRGPQLGEFDHFVWVTMTERGPIFANLQLEGIFDDNVFTEEMNTFAEKLWSSDVVRVEPLYISEELFVKDSLRFRLTNSFDVPMNVRLQSGFSRDMKTDLPTPEVVVPPNSVRFVAMGLEARKPKPVDAIKGAKVKIEVAVQQEGKKNLLVPFEFNAAPLRRHELTKTQKSIVIDGKLNEWKNLPYAINTSEGARFGVQYDDRFVYLGVQVDDTELLAKADATTFNQDFVGFVMDAKPMAQSAADKGDNWFASSVYLIASPEDASGKNSVYDMSEEEKSLTWKCVKNEKGYAFEIALPIGYVEKLQGKNWQSLRVNVVVQDRDSNSPRSSRIFWQPNWRDADNLPGSGMFFRK